MTSCDNVNFKIGRGFQCIPLANGRIPLQDIETRLGICSFSRAARRLSRTFAALLATFPVLACQNADFLQSSHHLELGVRFSTHDPRIIQQSFRALTRWSEIADLAWHREDSNNCSINIEDGKFTDAEEIAEADVEAGSITFASAGKLTANELFITVFHEIGHLLGLQHNPSPHSVMYWFNIRGDEVLNEPDMRALAAMHALRGGSGCNESARCEVLPGPLEEKQPRKENAISEAIMIASAKWLAEARTSRSRHHHFVGRDQDAAEH